MQLQKLKELLAKVIVTECSSK